MKLVENARQAWKWFSVQALAMLALVPLIWSELPPETQEIIPPTWRPWIVTGVALAGIAGRLIAQPKAGVE